MGRLAATALALIYTLTCATFARSQSFDLQERCAAQARKAFKEFESESGASRSTLLGESAVGDDYQSHYNAKLRRCLVLITESGSYTQPKFATYFALYLVDAYERRHYAVYSQTDAKVMFCELTPSVAQKRTCTTQDEFDAFIAPYMEE